MRTTAMAGLCLLATSAFASPEMMVFANNAPNFFGSSSWAAYEANATYAIEHGLNSYGSGVTAFNNVDGMTFDTSANIVTDFDSWMGQAPGAYSPEYGTRWHFGLVVFGTPSHQIRLEDLTFNLDSTGYDDLDYAGDFIGLTYNSRRYGILYGGNGIYGGGDDTYITSGAGTQMVDMLVYVGVGNATEALSTAPGATNQDKIDGVAAMIPTHDLTMTYTINDDVGSTSGSAMTHFEAVPEPATMSLLAVPALALLRKRRKA